MDEGLKRRLVGAGVLASLVVIFVPMLIEEPVREDPARFTPPEPPPKKAFVSELLSQELQAPEPLPIQRKPVEEEPSLSLPDVEKPRSEAPDSNVTRAVLGAWVVKVGSFSKRENATRLVAKLRAAGFQTLDAERVEVRGKVLYRVQVGPVVEKAKAEQILPKVNKVSGTESKVRRYR